MTRSAHRAAATVLAFVLVALHLDFWRAQRPRIWFGWIPEELLWRLVWMGLAGAYLVYFCARVWPDPEPAPEPEPDETARR